LPFNLNLYRYSAGGGGSDYVVYNKTIDRAIILSSKWAGPE
jgi:hypothetical protein